MQNRQNQDLLYYKYRTFHTDKFNSYFALKEKKKKSSFSFKHPSLILQILISQTDIRIISFDFVRGKKYQNKKHHQAIELE